MRKTKEYRPPETTNCALYARVSATEQAIENASIKTQLEACRAFAQSRGWHVVSEYVDPGASAWKNI